MGFNNGIRFTGFVSLVLGSTLFGLGAWTCFVYSRPVVPERYSTVKCNNHNGFLESVYYLKKFTTTTPDIKTSTGSARDDTDIQAILSAKCRATEDLIESSLVRHSMWIVCLSLTQILSAFFVLPSLTNEVAVTEAKHWILMQCVILCSYCLSFASQVSSLDTLNNPVQQFMDVNQITITPDYVYSFLWSISLCIVLGFIDVFLAGILIVCYASQNSRFRESAIIKV